MCGRFPNLKAHQRIPEIDNRSSRRKWSNTNFYGSESKDDIRVSISGNEEPSVRGQHCVSHTRRFEQLVSGKIRNQLRVGAAVRSPRHCSTSGGGEEGSYDDETGENGRSGVGQLDFDVNVGDGPSNSHQIVVSICCSQLSW